MAASRIRGITVEIGGDTTGLDKALKSVNSTIKDTQSQLKDVRAAIKAEKGNGCKCDVVSERDLFEAVFRFLGKKWSGLENVKEEDFDGVERIDVFNGMGVRIMVKEGERAARNV